MTDINLYDDLNVDLGEKLERLESENHELKSKIANLSEKLRLESETVEKIQNENKNLNENISRLHATAKAEIARKDNTISELRKELDSVIFRRNNRPNNFVNRTQNAVNQNKNIAYNIKNEYVSKSGNINTKFNANFIQGTIKNESSEQTLRHINSYDAQKKTEIIPSNSFTPNSNVRKDELPISNYTKVKTENDISKPGSFSYEKISECRSETVENLNKEDSDDQSGPEKKPSSQKHNETIFSNRMKSKLHVSRGELKRSNQKDDRLLPENKTESISDKERSKLDNSDSRSRSKSRNRNNVISLEQYRNKNKETSILTENRSDPLTISETERVKKYKERSRSSEKRVTTDRKSKSIERENSGRQSRKRQRSKSRSRNDSEKRSKSREAENREKKLKYDDKRPKANSKDRDSRRKSRLDYRDRSKSRDSGDRDNQSKHYDSKYYKRSTNDATGYNYRRRSRSRESTGYSRDKRYRDPEYETKSISKDKTARWNTLEKRHTRSKSKDRSEYGSPRSVDIKCRSEKSKYDKSEAKEQFIDNNRSSSDKKSRSERQSKTKCDIDKKETEKPLEKSCATIETETKVKRVECIQEKPETSNNAVKLEKITENLTHGSLQNNSVPVFQETEKINTENGNKDKCKENNPVPTNVENKCPNNINTGPSENLSENKNIGILSSPSQMVNTTSVYSKQIISDSKVRIVVKRRKK